jgi:hypothetical protein
MAELLENIPTEQCWAITAKTLLTICVLRGVKTVMPTMGVEDGIISPVRGLEKFKEIIDKVQGEGAKRFFPRVKNKFNIPVENAIDANDLIEIVQELAFGPEWEGEYVEKTPERVVVRYNKCPWMERYKEFEVDHGLIVCPSTCQLFSEEGLKAVNPKLNYKLTKAMPWGDPYCEEVIEFKEE